MKIRGGGGGGFFSCFILQLFVKNLTEFLHFGKKEDGIHQEASHIRKSHHFVHFSLRKSHHFVHFRLNYEGNMLSMTQYPIVDVYLHMLEGDVRVHFAGPGTATLTLTVKKILVELDNILFDRAQAEASTSCNKQLKVSLFFLHSDLFHHSFVYIMKNLMIPLCPIIH
ncbi:hypothetical protein ACJX0J_029912 [Zea mays]